MFWFTSPNKSNSHNQSARSQLIFSRTIKLDYVCFVCGFLKEKVRKDFLLKKTTYKKKWTFSLRKPHTKETKYMTKWKTSGLSPEEKHIQKINDFAL
jgi:hypothetical protein